MCFRPRVLRETSNFRGTVRSVTKSKDPCDTPYIHSTTYKHTLGVYVLQCVVKSMLHPCSRGEKWHLDLFGCWCSSVFNPPRSRIRRRSTTENDFFLPANAVAHYRNSVMWCVEGHKSASRPPLELLQQENDGPSGPVCVCMYVWVWQYLIKSQCY